MRFGSLFSGIGGLDLGLERAGMECAWQVEIEPYCLKVLEKHWPEVKRYGNVKEIEWSQVEPVDLICGGFPCQPFSVAGKRRGAADERNLWPEMLRAIRGVRPCWVLGENVPGLGSYLDTICSDLEGEGYEVLPLEIPAAAFGAPHLRYRLFIVAYAEDKRWKWSGRTRFWGDGLEDGGEDVAYTDGTGCKASRPDVPSGRDAARTLPGDTSERRDWQSWWETKPDVRGVDDGISKGLDGGLDGQGMDSVGGSHRQSEELLRGVWREIASRASPQGHGSDEQLAGELADAMPKMPHRATLAGGETGMEAASRFVFRVRRALSEDGALRHASEPILPAWESIPEEVQGRTFLAAYGRTDWSSGEWLGVPRIATSITNRVDRLRCLGNAVVPQVAEWLGRRILNDLS